MKYAWDFGDGTVIETTTETKIQHIYKYEAPAKESYTFPVSATADNGNCNYQVKHSVTFEITDIKVSIENRYVCRNDDTPYILTIKSENKKVILSGEGVSQNDAGRYVFIGYNVPENVDKVIVMANGKPSGLVITMRNLPIAKFTYAIKDTDLVLTNNSVNAEIYKWDIAGEIVETDSNSEIIRPLSSYKSTSITISLTASNRDCGESIDGPKDVLLRVIIPTTNCLKNATAFIKKTTESFAKIHQQPEIGKFSPETTSLIDEIERQFKIVNENTTDFINGNSNNQLGEMYRDFIYESFLSTVRNTKIAEEKTTLNFLIESHISLFYTILKCQKPDVLKTFQDQITTITPRFETLFKSFIKIKYSTDPNGTLKEFLTEMAVNFKDVQFILDAINSEISNLS